jgi:hypothetical protein
MAAHGPHGGGRRCAKPAHRNVCAGAAAHGPHGSRGVGGA